MAQHRTRQECLDRLKAEAYSVAPGQKVVVDGFRPADAEGIARIYYAIYGDTFPIDYVYDPERIREANGTDDLFHVVGRTQSGDVVGVMALFRSAPGRGILESGGLMILPEYRQGLLLFRLYDMNQKLARSLPWLNAEYSQMVTDIETPQKMSNRFGARGLALELEAMGPRPGGDGRRMSFVDEFIVLRDVPQDIHLPERYAGLLRGQYASFGLERRFLPGREPTGCTRLERGELAWADLVKIQVAEIGADFAEALRGALCEALCEAEQGNASRVAQLLLPLTDPGLPRAVELAREQGFWLGGLLPLWTDADVLLMQKLPARPDFDAVFLLTDEAQALMREVRADHDEVCPAQPERVG